MSPEIELCSTRRRGEGIKGRVPYCRFHQSNGPAVAITDAPRDWPEAIYQRADEALYAAKRSG